MDTFLDFTLYSSSDPEQPVGQYEGAGTAGLLALYRAVEQPEAARDYLLTILEAVGYTPALKSCYLYALPSKQPPSFRRFVQELEVTRFLLFGDSFGALGLHLEMAPYEAVHWNGLVLLTADPLLEIQREREAGGKAKAGALWKALKTHFAPPAL